MTLSPSPWLLVFDLDGTLIDSSMDLCLAVNAAMAHVDAPQLPHPRITSYVGDGAAMLVRRALTGTGSIADASFLGGVQEARFEKAFVFFLEYYQKHKLDNTRVYDEVLASLETIRSQAPDLPMAVLTNKPVRPSREICQALGLARYFFATYGGNSFATKKPNPEGLLQLMNEARTLWKQQGLSAERLSTKDVWMIGDSDADVLTARRAGARSLGCFYGLSPQALALSKPDLVCASPAEWPERLLSQAP